LLGVLTDPHKLDVRLGAAPHLLTGEIGKLVRIQAQKAHRPLGDNLVNTRSHLRDRRQLTVIAAGKTCFLLILGNRAQRTFDQVEAEFFAAAEINQALSRTCRFDLHACGKRLQLLIVEATQATDATQTGDIWMDCVYHELSTCKLR
jgi:hypothetical protein